MKNALTGNNQNAACSRRPSVVAAEVTSLTLAERNAGRSEPPYVGCYFLNSLPAFTIIELLVVIAVLAILAGLLLPALSRSKQQALRAGCLSNIRQLQICSHLYALDHSDRLPPNNFLYDNDTGAPLAGSSAEITWCPGWVRYDTTSANIEKGLLFPYSRSAAIYHCPADKSNVQHTNGAPLPFLRKRSYSLSTAINGQPTTPDHTVWPPSFQTESEINNPSPAQVFCFIDAHEAETGDPQSGFGTFPPGWERFSLPNWWDLPADRHSQGCDLSFADGHVEHWRWAAPKIFKRIGQDFGSPADLKDFRRLQAGVRPETRF